jgi:hypothetical protein
VNRFTIALALASLSLTACAVAPENYERTISMNWNLAPASSEKTHRTVEAGDVILSWTAEAKATHVMDGASGPVPLVAARTSYGQLYCGTRTCYEDRNADGAFDYEWQLGRNGAPPNEARAANNPKQLKTQIAFRATEAAGNPVFQQVLGLVYTGPLEGVPKEDQTLLPMIGELSLGWYGGAGSARTPDGSGWSIEQRIPMILADGVAPKTTISPLGLTYKALRATIDGMLELEYQARPVENIDLDAKPKFDVEEEADPAEKPAPLQP